MSLLPRRALPVFARTARASSSSSAPLASAAYTAPPGAPSDSASTSTPADLTPHQRDALSAALRVDHAGEIAANWIYAGQAAVLGRDPQTGALIEDMWAQERKHLAVMERLVGQHRARPTALQPLAMLGGWAVGAGSALLGKEAAMACTEAVETVIGEHYDDQLKELDALPHHPSIELLKGVVREFRDDELEHLDLAVAHDSQKAPAHALLSSVVGAGCAVAIELCKRF